MPSLRRCPLANWPKISVGNWAPPPKERRGHSLSGTRETWLASFESLSTVLPPLATTTRCRPPKMGLFACPIPPWFVLSCNLPMTNARAIWLRFGAFLSPPASSLQFHWPLATDHHSPVARSTPEPAGSGRAQTLPTCYCLTPTANCQRPNGVQSRRTTTLYIQYITEPGDSCGEINPLFLARRRRTLDHSLVAGGAQRQSLQACLPDGHTAQCLFSACSP